MTRWARTAAVLLVLFTALIASPSAAGAAPDDAVASHVLVIGVPGLTWSDVDPTATPELWTMAENSAIGAMSVRAARSTTCILDGWATIGAGNRARVPGPDDGLPPVPLPTVPLPEDQADPTVGPDGGQSEEPPVDTSLSHCGLQERAASVALADPVATVVRTAQDEGTVRFGAEPGALGTAVGCATVSGRAATVAVAVEGVQLSVVDDLPTEPAQLAGVLAACPLTLVSLDQLTDAGQPGVDRTAEGTDPQERPAALQRIDRAVGQLRAAVAAMDGETLVVLAGISEVNDGRPQLHVGMASGPGFSSNGWLTSASTGRAPFAQLIDVAPTALQALGLEQPASMNGQPMVSRGQRPDLSAAVQELRDANTAATVHYRSTSAFFWSLVIVSAVLVALGILVLGGLRGKSGRTPDAGRRPLRVVAVAAAALPIATYLAGLVPWERFPAPVVTLVVSVLAADLVVTALALLGPWRRHRLGPALAVLAVTVGTLFADVLTGSTLELNGLLGYDAIVAGRFTGYGNLTFGLMAVSALGMTGLLAVLAGRRAGPERERTAAGGTVLLLGAVTVGIIGAPGLGRDFGGVLASLPGFLVLAMLLARVRVTVLRFLGVLAAAVIAVGAVAVLDWTRPPADRTHLGRFVEQVLTGEAWTVISRKGQANLDILLRSSLAWMLPVAIVAAVWLVRPGGLLRSRPGHPAGSAAGLSPAQTFVVRAVLLSALLSLVLGAAVNDSGVALPATAAALLVPLMVWLAAGAGSGGTGSGETSGGTPHSGPVEGAERVTVVTRGSTVWNT